MVGTYVVEIDESADNVLLKAFLFDTNVADAQDFKLRRA